MSELMGQYLETDPTLTNGQIAPLRLTVDGKVMTDSAGGGGDATAANQVTEITKLTNIETNTGTIAGKDFATRSNQNTEIASLASIDGKVATETTLAALNAKFINTFSWFQNLAADITLNIKASAGTVFSFYVFNTTGSTVYFQLWNSATTAASGSLVDVWMVPAGSQVQIDESYFSQEGRAFSTGIAFGISSTLSTYTGASAQVVSVRYK